jgi:hypothetical protein
MSIHHTSKHLLFGDIVAAAGVALLTVGATMEDWINADSGSIWTQAVKSVVVKWDGGY